MALEQVLEAELARQHEHRATLQNLAQQQQVPLGNGQEPYAQQARLPFLPLLP